MPIPIVTAVVIYFTIWWIVLFAVLPFGITAPDDAAEVVKGSDPGAPARPHLFAKALWTTGISAIVLAIVLALFAYFG